LELVDGPRDMRFAMTAKTLARVEKTKQEVNELTQKNIEKVTRYRPNGEEDLQEMVEAMKEDEEKLFTRRRPDGKVEEKYQWGKIHEKHGKRKVL
jgi:large subunit ribosomal protein L17